MIGQKLAHTAMAYGAWLRSEIESARPLRPRSRRDRTAVLLAWALPPRVSGGVYRPTSFLEYGHKLGWKLSAVCGPAPEHETEAGLRLLARIPHEVTIHRVPDGQLNPIWRLFPSIDGGFAEALATYREARSVLLDSPPSIVIASGPPFHTFPAAFFLARNFGARLVLDYRDEWTECPFDFVFRGVADRYWEKRCLAAADLIVFTTASQRQHQLTTFRELHPTKCHVVANGWDPADLSRGPSASPVMPDTITLSFVGYLGPHCPPDGFLKTLRKLLDRAPAWRDRLKIQFVGTAHQQCTRAIAEFPWPAVVCQQGQLPKAEALQMMQQSHALLVFSEEGLARYLPGKIYEYFAASRPVLVIGYPGEASELVTRQSRGWHIPSDDDKALEMALLRIAEMGASSSLDEHTIKSWLSEHTRERQAARFFSLLNELL